MGVVVIDVDVQDTLKLLTAADQEPIEAVGADAADEPLGVCVSIRRTIRRLDDA